MRDILIVLDQGSSSSRAMAVDAGGNIVAQTRRAIRAQFPAPGMSHYDARELLQSQLDALYELFEKLASSDEPAVLGVAAQRSTIILWDKKSGEPLCPALSWQDGRAAGLLSEVKLSHEKTHELTGLYKTPYYSASKIAWCLRNYPDAALAAKNGTLAIGTVGSYLVWSLTGGEIFAADPTLAQRTMLFDLQSWGWNKELAALFDVPENCLPRILATTEDYGVFNSPRGPLPIRVMIGDQQAAMLGAGVFSAETAAINYGTGAFFLAATGGKRLSLPGFLNSVSPLPGEYLIEGTVNAASSMLDWLRQLGIEFDAEDVDELCLASQNPPRVLCAIGGIGSPYWDYKTSTTFTGMNLKTCKADIVRGTLEGIAAMLAVNALAAKRAGAGFTKIMASGGLSNSDFLLQLQSDLLQMPVERCSVAETTALGAAWLMARDRGLLRQEWGGGTGKIFSPAIDSKTAAARMENWLKFYDGVKILTEKLS
jgi:glycerol kinase